MYLKVVIVGKCDSKLREGAFDREVLHDNAEDINNFVESEVHTLFFW